MIGAEIAKKYLTELKLISKIILLNKINNGGNKGVSHNVLILNYEFRFFYFCCITAAISNNSINTANNNEYPLINYIKLFIYKKNINM